MNMQNKEIISPLHFVKLNYKSFNKALVKLFPNFTRQELITYANVTYFSGKL